MINRKNKCIFYIVVCLIVLFGCTDPPPTHLVNGYCYVSLDSKNANISLGHFPVVHANVTKIEVVGIFILGLHSEYIGQGAYTRSNTDPYGFFVIDTVTGEVTFGLSDADFRNYRNTLIKNKTSSSVKQVLSECGIN